VYQRQGVSFGSFGGGGFVDRPNATTVRAALQHSGVPYLGQSRDIVARLGRPCRGTVDFSAIAQKGQVCLQRSRPGPPAL
jgi:hypothetical protein